MDCDRIRTLLDAYLDGELGRDDAKIVDRHLQHCRACRGRLDANRALSAGVRSHATYRSAPSALRTRIRAAIAEAPVPQQTPRWRQRFRRLDPSRWLPMSGAVAGAVLTTAALTFTVTVQLAGVSQEQRMIDQLVSGHSRAVLTSHQIDVASSDQHTVKPWLSSKLDFSPNVADLAAAGFPLLGGRLDYINDRPVAVLVYGHRRHVVDLFIWPDDGSAARAMRNFSKRGVNIVQWSAGGMAFSAVSDVNTDDLKEFARSYSSTESGPVR
jgi:anti-sigma factor (TIGR02949 family)